MSQTDTTSESIGRDDQSQKKSNYVLKKLQETWITEYKGYESDETTSDASEDESKYPPIARKKNKEKKNMENILFYGDSLTWGMAHNYTGRYEKTFPKSIKKKLQAIGLNVFEAGLCSRTTIFEDDGNEKWMAGARPDFFDGFSHFASEFLNATPTWLIILLGTNDLRTSIRVQAKSRTRMDATVIAQNCARIGLKARQLHKESGFFHRSSKLNIVIVAPPRIRYCGLSSNLGYDETSFKISKSFNEAYESMCKEHDFIFVKNEITSDKSMDGVHLTKRSNGIIALAILHTIYEKVAPRLLKKATLAKKQNDKSLKTGSNLANLRKRKDFDFFLFLHSKRRRFNEGDLSDDDNKAVGRPGHFKPMFQTVDLREEDVGLRNLKYTYFRRGRPSRQEIEFKPIGKQLLNELINRIEFDFRDR